MEPMNRDTSMNITQAQSSGAYSCEHNVEFPDMGCVQSVKTLVPSPWVMVTGDSNSFYRLDSRISYSDGEIRVRYAFGGIRGIYIYIIASLSMTPSRRVLI